MPTNATKMVARSKGTAPRHSPQSEWDRYAAAARRFHWVIAVLIVGMFATDWMREAFERGSPWQAWLLTTHESLGLLVLALSVARLGWRLIHPAPPALGSPLVQTAAKAGHILLYLATIGLPLAGIARAMLKGDPIVFFGLVIPSLTGRNDLLRSTAHFVHGGLIMNLLLALIAGHAIAALWHQLVLKDGTMRRML